MSLANRDFFAIPEIREQMRGDVYDQNARPEDFDPTHWRYSNPDASKRGSDELPDLCLRTCNINPKQHAQYTLSGAKGYWARVGDLDDEGRLQLEPCDFCVRDWEQLTSGYAARLKASRIPGRFLNQDEGNPFAWFNADSPAKKSTLDAAISIACLNDNFGSISWGNVFAGGVGSGKTSTACSIADEWAWLGVRVLYLTERDLYREIRSAWDKGAERTERQVLHDLVHKYALLILDDIGTGANTEAEKGHLYDVLDGRYGAQETTIVCTNLSRKDLSAYLGTRLFDRLRDGGKWVSFDWPSARGKGTDKVVDINAKQLKPRPEPEPEHRPVSIV